MTESGHEHDAQTPGRVAVRGRVSARDIAIFSSVFAILGVILSGFGFVRQSDLVGTYTADHKAARETLTLLPDGKFIQRAALKYDSQVLVAKGTWMYEDSAIFLKDFLYTTHDGLGQPRKELGDCRYPTFRWFWKVKVGGDECDGAIQYEKQSSL